MNRYFILFILINILLISCTKNDRAKPSFTLVSPVDSNYFQSGQSIPFNCTFFDNENLSQYKIVIHNAFDGHTHEKYLAPIWEHILVENITGTEFPVSYAIPIPDSAASGWYHFIVSAVDLAGNQSDIDFRTFFIQNAADTSAPLVSFSTPTAGDVFSLGNNIYVNANVSDNERVFVVNTRIRKTDESSSIYFATDTFGTNSILYNKEIPTSGTSWTSGDYELSLIAYDSYYNMYTLSVLFSIN